MYSNLWINIGIKINLFFEERHKNHQKKRIFSLLFNKYEDYSFATKIFRMHFCRKPASFLSNRFCPSVFCTCFYCTSSYCAPDLIFILPARRKTSSLLSAMSPTGNLDTTLSCLRQKKSAKFKEKFIALFCVDFCAENFLFAAIGR